MTVPVAGCIGPRSYRTMREAWEAVRADRSPIAPVPFRCSVCKYWHITPTVGQGHESTLDNELVKPARGPAEPYFEEQAA